MTQRYNFGEAFSYFDMPQEFAQTASFRSQNNPAVYTPGGIMNPELLQKLARGQAPAEESRGIIDILKSGAAGARDIFLQGAGATGGLNIGARTGMMFGPEFALPFGIAGAVLGSKFTEMGPSGSFYEGLTEDQQAAVDQIYGDKGIMAGYNPVSRFGRGAAGSSGRHPESWRLCQALAQLLERPSTSVPTGLAACLGRVPPPLLSRIQPTQTPRTPARSQRTG